MVGHMFKRAHSDENLHKIQPLETLKFVILCFWSQIVRIVVKDAFPKEFFQQVENVFYSIFGKFKIFDFCLWPQKVKSCSPEETFARVKS